MKSSYFDIYIRTHTKKDERVVDEVSNNTIVIRLSLLVIKLVN